MRRVWAVGVLNYRWIPFDDSHAVVDGLWLALSPYPDPCKDTCWPCVHQLGIRQHQMLAQANVKAIDNAFKELPAHGGKRQVSWIEPFHPIRDNFLLL